MNYDIIAGDIQLYIERCKNFTRFNMRREYSPLVEKEVFEKYLYSTDQFVYLAKEADDVIRDKDFKRGENTYYRNFENKNVADFIFAKFEYSLIERDAAPVESWKYLDFNCVPYVEKIHFKEWPFNDNFGLSGISTLTATKLFEDLEMENKIRESLKDTPIVEELKHTEEVVFHIEQNILYGDARRKSSILESNLPILTQFFDEKGRFKEGFNPDPIDLREVEIQ